MNKMLKLVLIAGVALILGGGLVYGAAYAMGEKLTDSRVTSLLTHTFPPNRKISSLKIDGMVAKVNIKINTENEIKIDAHDIIEDYFKYELGTDGTLRLSYSPNWKNLGFINIPGPGLITARKTTVIDIYVPEGMVFDRVDIDGGVGEHDIDYINAGELRLGGGIGKINIRDSRIDRLKIDGGVGEHIIHGDMGELSIDGGVGVIKVSGSVARDIKISGGVGEIKLDMAGDINNYDVRADNGVGTIRINGEKASAYRNYEMADRGTTTIDGEKADAYGNAAAPYNLRVDGGVGSISINIK